MNEILLKERNLICSHLIEIPSVEKMKKFRKKIQYYNKVLSESSPEAATNPIFNLFNKEEKISEFSETIDNFSRENALENDEIPSDFDSEDEEGEK